MTISQNNLYSELKARFKTKNPLLSESQKKKIYTQLKNNKYEYGNIPQEDILNYLEIKVEEKFDPYDQGSENIIYLYDLVFEKVYNQEGVQNIIQEYIDQYLKDRKTEKLKFFEDNDVDVIVSVSSFDSFPQIEIELYEKIELEKSKFKIIDFNERRNIITIVYPLYGMQTKSKISTVKSIYGMTVEEYRKFYSNWTIDLSNNFFNYLMNKNSFNLVKLNKNKVKIPDFGITKIYNLPLIAKRLLKFETTTWRDLENEIYFPTPSPKISMSQSFLLTKLLKEKLDKDKLKLLINTELNIDKLLSSDEIIKQSKKLKNYKVKNPFDLVPNDIIRGMFNKVGIKIDSSTDLKRQFNELIHEKLSEELNVIFEKFEQIAPEFSDMSDNYYYFYMSSRGLVPYETLNTKAYLLLKTYLQDLGIPTDDKENPNPMNSKFIKYIDSNINNTSFETQIILDICTQIGLKDYHEIIDWTIIKQILLNGHIEDLPFDEKFLKRYDYWKSLSDQQQVLMKAVYNVPFINAQIFCNIKNIEIKAEKIIKSFDGTNLKEIMIGEDGYTGLEMLVPESTDYMDYFIETLPNYLYFINRPKNFDCQEEQDKIRNDSKSEAEKIFENFKNFFKQCSDMEICFSILGGFPGHKNRNDLLNYALLYCKGKQLLLYNRPVEIIVTDENKNEEKRKKLYIDCFAPSNNKYNLCFVYSNSKKNFDFTISEFAMLNAAFSNGENFAITANNSICITDGELIKTSKYSEEPNKIALDKEMQENFIHIFTEMQFYFQRLINEAFDNGEFITKDKDGTDEENKDFYSINKKGKKILNNINKDLKMRPAKQKQVDAEMDEEDDYYIILNSIITLEKINNIYKDIEMRLKITNERDRGYWNKFSSFPKEVKDTICNMLVMLFDTGMRQRQWKGNRDEYPMSSSQTGSEYAFYENMKKTKEEIVGDSIVFINEKMDFLRKNYSKFEAAEFFAGLVCMTPDARNEAANFKPEMVERTVNENGRSILKITEIDIIYLLQQLGRGDLNSSDYINQSINQFQQSINKLQNEVSQIQLQISNSKDKTNTKKLEKQSKQKTEEILNIKKRMDTMNTNIKKSEIANEYNASTGWCIRVGSTKMIYTGYYYLRIFDSVKKLGKFEFWKLDPIS